MQTTRFSVVFLVMLAVVSFIAPTTGAAAVPSSAEQAPFDPAQFGRILTDEELDAVDGEWVAAAVGGAIGAATYIIVNGVDASSAEWWAGLAVSTVTGALFGF